MRLFMVNTVRAINSTAAATGASVPAPTPQQQRYRIRNHTCEG
jgi:hypothetical protein